MNYALIENGMVINIITLGPDNANEFPNAVRFTDMAVQIGDSYSDGKFYRDGELVLTDYELAMIAAKRWLMFEAEQAYIEGVNSI